MRGSRITPLGWAVGFVLAVLLSATLAGWLTQPSPSGNVKASYRPTMMAPTTSQEQSPWPSGSMPATEPSVSVIPTTEQPSYSYGYGAEQTTVAPTPTISPLPQGEITPVEAPVQSMDVGFTAGDLSQSADTGYSVVVPTATVSRHWGFSYNYQCQDPGTDDAFRWANPNDGAFSVRLGSTYLLRGNSYMGAGFVRVYSPNGPPIHSLLVSGPCIYQLDYFSFGG
jgi:hypothetical protein